MAAAFIIKGPNDSNTIKPSITMDQDVICQGQFKHKIHVKSKINTNYLNLNTR